MLEHLQKITGSITQNLLLMRKWMKEMLEKPISSITFKSTLSTKNCVPTKPLKKGTPVHKKIMEKASKALKKDAAHYKKEEKKASSPAKKKHEMIERKEAMSAAKDMKKRASKAHEY